MKTTSDASLAAIVDELRMIKLLLAAGLLHSGLSQAELAATLGINQSTISRMLQGRVTQGKKRR